MHCFFCTCLQRQLILVEKVFNKNRRDHKWYGQENNTHNELPCRVPYCVIRGKEIVSYKAS